MPPLEIARGPARWPEPGTDDAAKHRFLEQAAVCDAGYPGGIVQYVKNAKQLLQASKEGKNPFDGWTPSAGSYTRPLFGST
jgi:UDP-sugar pyrophosphorylase